MQILGTDYCCCDTSCCELNYAVEYPDCLELDPCCQNGVSAIESEGTFVSNSSSSSTSLQAFTDGIEHKEMEAMARLFDVDIRR